MMSTVVLSVSHHQGSISPTFYAKLLCSMIPNAKKIQSSCQSFIVLMGSVCVKVEHKMLVKLTPDRDVLVKLLYLAFYSADERS
jgi:hypothetical protein